MTFKVKLIRWSEETVLEVEAENGVQAIKEMRLCIADWYRSVDSAFGVYTEEEIESEIEKIITNQHNELELLCG